MRLIIDRAENGYILSFKNEDDKIEKTLHSSSNLFDPDEVSALVSLLRDVTEKLGHFGSSYDSEQVFIGVLPGRKYEGPMTSKVKETLEQIEYLTSGLE